MDLEATLAEHLSWLRLRGLRPTTVTQRAYAVRRLARELHPLPLLAAGEDDLKRWQAGLHLTPVAHCCEVGHVAQFFKWAQLEAGLIEDDPTLRLIRPKKPRRLPRPISDADLYMAIDTATPMIRAALVLGAFEGLRAGEVARLTRDAVHDSADPPVLFIDGKGGDERIVPLSERALMALRAYGLPTRGAVFRRLDGRPGHNSPARMSQLVNRHLHGLGIAATFHQCRHFFGTAIHEATQDIRVTQELMGHRDPATTAGYVKWNSKRVVGQFGFARYGIHI